MSMSPIARLVRPAILILAGMLLGQGALAVAAPSAPAAVQRRIASCAGWDFHPIDHLTEFRWYERHLARISDDGDGWFMCPAVLPHRAVVTRVRFTVSDKHDLIELRYCGLVRTPLGLSGGIKALAIAISTTGMAAEPGVDRYSTSEIDLATIDNGRFAYSFQCQIAYHDTLSGAGPNFAGIIGADVTYRIDSADG